VLSDAFNMIHTALMSAVFVYLIVWVWRKLFGG